MIVFDMWVTDIGREGCGSVVTAKLILGERLDGLTLRLSV